MSDIAITELLKQLHGALENAPSIGEKDRELLAQLSLDIQGLLARQGQGELRVCLRANQQRVSLSVVAVGDPRPRHGHLRGGPLAAANPLRDLPGGQRRAARPVWLATALAARH